MAFPDTAVAPDSGVENAPLDAFVFLTQPGLAKGRDGTPRVMPAELDLDGVPRRVDADQARQLARALEEAAAALERANAELLPPLHDYCDRYAAHQEETVY